MTLPVNFTFNVLTISSAVVFALNLTTGFALEFDPKEKHVRDEDAAIIFCSVLLVHLDVGHDELILEF